MAFVEFRDVRKTYKMGELEVAAVDGMTFDIEEGELVVVVGPSGAGKTTLLNMLGGMDSCTSGTITLDGREVSSFDQKELTLYRRHDIGFVFQFYNLVQNLTALENVELASQICKNPLDPAETLRSVGLGHRLANFPSQLSGGEQQRVAIARALAKNPKLLLCDEPTGALDYRTGKSILSLLQKTSGVGEGLAGGCADGADGCAGGRGDECADGHAGGVDGHADGHAACADSHARTVVIITHNQAFTAIANRVIRVREGRIVSVELNENPVSADTIEW